MAGTFRELPIDEQARRDAEKKSRELRGRNALAVSKPEVGDVVELEYTWNGTGPYRKLGAVTALRFMTNATGLPIPTEFAVDGTKVSMRNIVKVTIIKRRGKSNCG